MYVKVREQLQGVFQYIIVCAGIYMYKYKYIYMCI